MDPGSPGAPEPGGEASLRRLEGYLRALASERRLELLAMLRAPKTLDQIRLHPGPAQAQGNPDRAISRQGVHGHLERLLEAGMVRQRLAPGGRRPVVEYYADRARLFAVLEELRRLSALEDGVSPDPFLTSGLADAREVTWGEPGPKLVLVHGVGEGRAFPLRARELAPPRGWVVGRGQPAHVRLPYDPYVSSEHAEVLPTGGAFTLLALRTARNPTMLNWRRLPPGGEAPLAPGDVIGAGRSLLVFRGA